MARSVQRRGGSWLGRLALGVALVAFLAAGAFVAFFDADRYRDDLAAALSEATGRTVRLEGPLRIGLSWNDGFTLSTEKVSVANPAWASRPLLAKIGGLHLGVGLAPLLQGRVVVSSFGLRDADILLEEGPGGQGNWDFGAGRKAAATSGAGGGKTAKASPSSVALQVDSARVTNSVFGWRGKGAAPVKLDVETLTAQAGLRGVSASLKGRYADTPVEATVKGGGLEALLKTSAPLQASLRFAGYRIEAEGTLKDAARTLDLARYEVLAGDSRVDGKMHVELGGAKPRLQGTVTSPGLALADFSAAAPEGKSKSGVASAGTSPEASGAAPDPGRVFSATPFNFGGLKAVDASLDVAIESLTAGLSTLTALRTKLDLQDGRLLLSPLSFRFAESEAKGQAKLDASAPAAVASLVLAAPQMDLAKLASLGGAESFIAGKGDLDLDVAAAGRSPHEWASAARGTFRLVAAGGSVSARAFDKVAGSLLDALAPGLGKLASSSMNCLALRGHILNGVATSDGMILDSSQGTVLGTGSVDLGQETLNLLLRTRAKGVAETGGLLPALRVQGTLAQPRFVVDASSGVREVAGLLLGQKGAGNGAEVPEVLAVAGQNACLATLDRPPSAASPGTAAKPAGKAQEAIKDLGDKLRKGLGEKLFGR